MSKRDASSRDSDSDDVELTPVTFVTTSRDDDAKAEPSIQPTANPLRRPTTSATTPPAPLVVVSSEQLFGDHFRHENGIVERFHVDTFLWEALTHFWFPFSLPVLLAFDGLVGCQNKLFLPRWGRAPEGTPKEMSGAANLFNVMTSWYFAITQLLPVVFAAIFAPWSLSVAIMAFGFNIFRVLTIGGKYACFPTDQYQRFIETPYCDVSKNLLIVTWYLDIPKHTIEEQIADAENFSGIQLDALPPLTLQGGMTITARQYFEQLIDATFGQRPPAVVNFLVETLARVFILMPIIALVVHYTRDELHTLFTDGGQMASREWASFVSCGLTTVALISMAPACAKFMYVAVLHHWRSYNVQQALLRAVVRSISAQKVDDFMIPIDLGTNLIVWDRLRVVARNFGRIYANRISFNTLAMVLVTLVSLLKLVFEVVVLGSSLIEPTTVVITAFIVTLFVFTCIMAFFGILYPVLVNGTDVEVVELLAHEELALFFKLGAPMKNNAVSDAVVDQLTLAQQDSLSHLAAHAASFYTNQRKFDPTRHLYRLKSMRASVEQRQRVDATEVMFIKATTKVLTAYLAYVGSACTVIIGFLIRDGRTL